MVHFGANVQHFFVVREDGGRFGTGTGPEYRRPYRAERGTYEPVWLSCRCLGDAEVRPLALRERLAAEGPEFLIGVPVLTLYDEP